ncbi:hypothetical protein ZWY2020_005365 [Hordeum vulgare]|nr:hypothetical protein ZWY2020_005365 [Hordeum vulgare]
MLSSGCFVPPVQVRRRALGDTRNTITEHNDGCERVPCCCYFSPHAYVVVPSNSQIPLLALNFPNTLCCCIRVQPRCWSKWRQSGVQSDEGL